MMKKTILILTIIICTANTILAQNQDLIEQKVDSLIQTYHRPNGPGIAVSVSKDGEIIYKNQTGYANLEYMIPISDTTVFHIASISKQFTAFAALLLEKEGKLSLDDDIKKYLPELNELPYKITIRQLANHTHGLPNVHELVHLIGITPQDVLSQQQMIRILLRLKQTNFVPGSKYQYNNTGFTLLAEIIQRVSGKTFSEYLKERIFEPLKMNHTLVLDNLGTIVKNKAYSYTQTEQGFEKIPFNFTLVGSSGINTTAQDLSLWAMNFHEPNPTIGGQAIFEKMKTPSHLNNGEKIPYALGQEWKKYKGLDVIFHGGGDAGYRAYLLRIPKYNFSVVVMGNFESFNPLDISYNIVDLYLKKYQTQQALEQVPQYTTNELKKWEGNYEIFPGNFFTLVAKNDSLYFQPFTSKETYPLPVLSEKTFSFPYAPHSKMEFTNKGLVWHFSDMAYLCKKASINLPDKANIDLNDFTGLYLNEELKTSYKLINKEGTLIAIHPLNNDIVLQPLAKDEFYSNQSFFGRIKFIRNNENKIVGFKLSGQNLNKITFKKIE